MDFSNTTPLSFQGDASSVAKCTLANGDVVFHKTGDAPAIAREVTQLQNLTNSSRILVTPKLISFGQNWLVTSWMAGHNLAEQFAMTDSTTRRTEICEQFGYVLCASMAISSQIPEPDDPFDAMFETLERFVQQHDSRVITDPDSCIHHRKLGDVWRDVIKDADSVIPEIRFMHGDWCLPNIMTVKAEPGVRAAIVDWSEAGWMDWHFCVADGLWSIGYNSRLAGTNALDFQRTFLDACEIEEESGVLNWFRKIRALMAII